MRSSPLPWAGPVSFLPAIEVTVVVAVATIGGASGLSMEPLFLYAGWERKAAVRSGKSNLLSRRRVPPGLTGEQAGFSCSCNSRVCNCGGSQADSDLLTVSAVRESVHSLRRCFPGACVIERDGHLFKYLLDYLHGEVRIPEDEQTRIALQEEADYFGIPYPDSLSDHLATEMETYSLRSNIELKKALADFCGSYGLVCSEPSVWVLHYLSTSGASCESRVIGVYATRADGMDAIERQLGGRIHSRSIFRREAGNNIQYIWSYYSVAELKKMMDAFDAWEGKGVSYWRVPHGLVECWTLEQRPLLGSACHAAPLRKRYRDDRETAGAEEGGGVSGRVGPQPVRYLGPSTSTQITVRNSASVRLAQASAGPAAVRVLAKRSQSGGHGRAAPSPVPPVGVETVKSPHCHGARSPENGAAPPLPAQAPPPSDKDRRAPPRRVIKLRRTPLCAAPAPPPLEAASAPSVPTGSASGRADGQDG